MIRTDKVYVHGTAAEKLEYNVYEENKVLKSKRRQKNNNRAKLRIICYIALIFSLFFAVMFRYAMITEMNYSADKLNKEYQRVKNENALLRVQIEKDTDLFRIRQIAESSLGMQMPDKYQLVYVQVPRNDFSISAASSRNGESSGNILAAMGDKLQKLAGLLY